ncbi:aminoglycoside phosphotransferase (APT) family kinase protein [Nonomuraea fuscirosea]|uniref:Aminoglycoside phosphotransferase (APT) family kinase protein n=1 Tax=Nonomuraea fuscirosea TaxID=1291556 RepID=A0A2T0MUL5_9ACTN|nr:phosphotransferase family protein [Nonomuraea fuscirosea]PRX62514.1 aminoglycoside phosphotransferase (APT) family kinase protein [Nonomuraea fuscirosea]
MTEQMRTSTRDLEELRRRATTWLRAKVGDGATVSEMSRPSENGMSSETLFFTATWNGRATRCVARLAPAPEAIPVFPSYDLEAQFTIMRLAREKAGIPAPRTLWFEPDPGPLGTPFFVMERAEGEVPADVMPYTFGGWLYDASPEDQRRLQDGSVAVLAALHRTAFTPAELAPFGAPGLRAHVDAQRAYYEWAHGAHRIPLLERAFDRLEQLWPDDPGPDVLLWGDARIGNLMFQDFTPVAVFDWEMAAVGPCELDLSWMIFLHRFFQDLTTGGGLPGMPGFMRAEDVCRTYRDLTGYEPRHLHFYELYAALRHGVIMARIWQRRIRFGEQTMPDDPDDMVLHRATIEELLAGYEPAS